MSDLIQRFKEDLQLADYAPRSIQSYAGAMYRLMRYYNKTPDQITEEDLRQYWLACENQFGWSKASLRISYSGIKHFYKRTLVREWDLLDNIKFKRERKIPLVLSCEQVKLIIDNLPNLQSKTFFITQYTLGLRLRECLTLKVTDILSDRGLVHIKKTKNKADRLVPLPRITLRHLKEYWLTHKNPVWLFPALGRNNGKGARHAQTHASVTTVQSHLKKTVHKLELNHEIHPHTFRHSYATHLLDNNVPITHVQKLLGHKVITSTMIYLHVTTAAQTNSNKRVTRIMQGVLS